MRFAILAHAAVTALASVGLIACDDPVPPTPQGAWSVNFQPQDGNTAACQVSGHHADIGSVTGTTKMHLIPNGMSEAGPLESSELDCSVVGKDKFDVDASMTQSVTMGLIGLHINVQGLTKAATPMSPAQGTATFSSPNTGGLPYAPPPGMPCNFYFLPNTLEGVDAGRVWVAFTCPALANAGTMSTCQLKESYAIFENCTQATAN